MSFNEENYFSLVHINIRSLKKNFAELLVTLENNFKNLDVLVITEPNINFSLLSFYKTDGFNINSFVRVGRSGGGVLV